MILNFADLSPTQRYFAMVQSIIPRPIAWVLSDNGAPASYNLAPYSFFTGVCSDPPLLMISAGLKRGGAEDGQAKDTRRNVLERKQFVVHIASTAQIDAVNRSAETLPHGTSEISQLGLETRPFDDFPLPRLSACGIALACTLYRIDEIGSAPQAVIYGEIVKAYVADELVQPGDSQRLVLDSQRIDPLARLGGEYYSALGQRLRAERPD